MLSEGLDACEMKELIELCQGLIRQRSVTGNERDCVNWLAQIMRSWGYDRVEVDPLGNLIGTIDCGEGPRVLFDGHIDTVGVSDTEQWTYDPFGGELVGDYIYGRGASDMKGALSAMVWAISRLDRRKVNGRIFVSATVLEEPLEGVSFQSVIQAVKPDFVVIGEATGLNLNIGQRGRAEIVVETMGRSAHSSNPEKGDNAVYKMVRAIDILKNLPPPHDELLGTGIFEVTDIISEPYPGLSVIPSYSKATFDKRLVRGESKDTVLSMIRDALYAGGLTTHDVRVSLAKMTATTYTGAVLENVEKLAPAWWFSPESEIVIKAKEALEVKGIPAKISTYSFCTNGSGSAGVLGIPTIGFGPGEEEMAHTTDERIQVKDLCIAARGYMALAEG